MSTKSTSTRRFAVSSIASGSIVAAVIRQVQIFSDATYVTLLDETKVNNAGGYIQIIGIGFQPGCVVYFNNVLLSSTFISSTVVRATTLAVSNGSYVLLVANSLGTSNNASAIYVLTASGFPTWTTTAYYSTSVTVSVQLVATGDAPLTYSLQSGSSLPAGTTLSSSGLLSGTITGATNGIVYSFVALVDDVDLQTTQATISLTILFSDAYYKNVTLLLNGETAVTPFIQDASTNNFNSTIAGDTRPTLFIPYQNGYYSNYFDGSGDYLTVPASSSTFSPGTNNLTVEGWYYFTNLSAGVTNLFGSNNGSGTTQKCMAYIEANGTIHFDLTAVGGASQATSASGAVVNNKWYHLAFVRNSSIATIYVNGTSVASGSATGNLNALTNPFYVGYIGEAYGVLMSGYISNFRYVNGTAVYTGAFTPPTTPLTATQSSGTNISAITGSSTSLLTSQSNRLIDNSLNNFTITKNGDVTVSPFIPFSAPTSVTVNNLYSTFFDGTGDYLTTPSNAVFGFSTGDFTIEGWFYFTGTISTYQRPWWFGDDNDNIEINGSVLRVGGASQGTLITGGTTIVASTWYHIALTRASGSYKLWLNGSQQGSTATNSYNSSARTFTAMATSGGSNPTTGYVSNLRVVKGIAVYTATFTPSTTQLTSTQSANVNGNPSEAITGTATSLLTCQNSTIIDNSTYVLTLTPAGDVRPINSTTPFTQTTTAVALTTLGGTYFDGTGDYLTVPDNAALDLSANFTCEAWVYLPNVSGEKSIFHNHVSDNNGIALNINGALPRMLSGNGAWQIIYDSSISIAANSWNHIAVTRNSNTYTIWVNGVSGGTATSSSTPTYSGGAQIGRFTSGLPLAYNGYISNLRIVKGTAVYTSNFAPPVQPLTAVTNTSLLTLQYNGGANNSGIIDNSAYNNILTRFGNTSQGTFTPFSQTGWSTFIGYGAYGYQNLPANTGYDVTGADFTIEFWINFSTWNTMGSSGSTIIGNFVSANGWLTGWNGGVGSALTFTTYGAGATNVVSTGIIQGTNFQLGTWNHITVMQKTNVIYFYLNGIMTYSTTAPVAVAAGQTMYIGVYAQNFSYAGNPYFYYSNLRIVKGTGLYSTAGFTPPTTPLTPIAGTTLLIGQSSNLVDNSGINATITNTVSGVAPSSQALSPFGSITQATPLSYSNYFDGTGDRLSIASNALLALGTGDFTIEMWVNNQSTTNRLISWGVTTSPIVYINGSNQLVYDNYGTGTLQTSTSTISLNTWTHVALSRNTGVTRMYINGVVANSTPLTDTNNWGQSGLYIGVDVSTTYMTGSISNLRVLKGTGLYPNGTTFTPSTSPLTAITNTLLLTCQSTTIIDNSTNAFTITTTGDVVPRNFNPFGYTDQTNSSYSPSTVGGSIYFDGTGDYLSIPSNSPFNTLYSTTVSFTLEFWMYPTFYTGATEYTMFVASSTGNTTVGFRIYYKGGIVYWYANNVEPAVTQTVQLNQWSHLAFVWNGTNITTYLNGGSKKTAASSWTNNGSTNVNYIGVLLPGTYNYYYFGYFSSLRLVSGAALYTNTFIPSTTPFTSINNTTSTTTMLLNFTSGGVIDYHSSNVLETVGNAQLSTNIKKFGNASMYFDGTGDYLLSPSIQFQNYNFGTSDFTIECWLYQTAFSGDKTIIASITTWSTSVNFYFATRAGTPNILLFRAGDSIPITLNGNTGIVASTWTHLAVCRASGVTRMFVDGVVQTATHTGSVNIGATIQSTWIGAWGSAVNEPMTGYIDDLRITKGFARYTGNFNTSSPISPAAAFLTQ